ncbi:MAG: hypothetical protein IT365_19590 [Candidatus Hydrogenedentes bacterium]|nr:hypothetical protein [Candidatus Hydrogenedentota bacterium]
MIGLCIVYPFLPGDYDAAAVPLSTSVQLYGAAELALVPMGITWLAYEVRAHLRRKRDRQSTRSAYYFAVASLITASVVASAVTLLVGFGISKAMGLFGFTLWFYAVYRVLPRLKSLRRTEAARINPAPLYLIILPPAVLLVGLALAAPLTEFSRNRAIANSGEFIRDIEAFHDKHGEYPVSLSAMWKDYYPDVIGVERFQYSRFGDSYNVFFEQPRFLFDNIGTREWVVYNPNDEHRMFSHTAGFLLLTPEDLDRSQGWYAVHDAGVPHWKYFWFD